MNREQEMKKILSREPIEIPESLLPENMKQRILEMESSSPDKKSVRKMGQRWKPFMNAGIAVAAGLAICVCSSYLTLSDGASLSHKGASENAAGRQEVAAVDGHIEFEEDGYELAFESLVKIRRDKQKAIPGKILKGLASGGLQTGNIKKSGDVAVAQEDDSLGFYAEASSNEVAESAENTVKSSTSSTGGTTKSYSDTNVRTQGVNEGDIVKTDGEYIYEYRNDTSAARDEKQSRKEKSLCNIYKADGADVERVASIHADEFNEAVYLQDMYVSGDRLILVGEFYSQDKKQIKKLYKQAGADFNNFNEKTWNLYGDVDDIFYANYSVVYVFDISDRSNPALKRMTFQDGSYFTSRMVEDVLYVFSKRSMPVKGIKKAEPESYIPQVNGCCVEEKRVCVPEDVRTQQYSLISSVDVQDCEMIDEVSVLAGSSELYVSGSNIYLLDESASYNRNGKSVITKFSYEDGKIKKKATGKVKGRVDDDYALDEYKGYLRLVTTYYTKKSTQNALYVLDENMKVTGSIKEIAGGERVYSARFMGDTAYFVTFRETDPLFTADLSDPANPKIVGKLKLPGYSDYLHPIGDHLLLGIGEEGDEDGDLDGIKLSLYDISNPKKVKEIQKEVLPEKYEYTSVTENPNELFIDEERGLIGFTAEGYEGYDYDEDSETYFAEGVVDDYLVYSFNEKTGFKKRLAASLKTVADSDWEYEEQEAQGRGLYIDDIFYVVSVGGGQIESYDYGTFHKKKTNTFKK